MAWAAPLDEGWRGLFATAAGLGFVIRSTDGLAPSGV